MRLDAPGSETVPLGWCIDAMDRAFERARSTGWNDPIGAYAAVAETLFWAMVVDEHMKLKYRAHYEAELANQHEDIESMLSGLLYARNRITHEVDEVGYIIAAARGPDSFAAVWTWQPLPPRPGDRQASLHRDYEKTIAGRDVAKTLLTVTIFLGATRNRMWQAYGKDPQRDEPPVATAAPTSLTGVTTWALGGRTALPDGDRQKRHGATPAVRSSAVIRPRDTALS